MTADSRVLTVRVSKELQDKLDNLGEELDRSRSWLIQKAIEYYIEATHLHGEGSGQSPAQPQAAQSQPNEKLDSMISTLINKYKE